MKKRIGIVPPAKLFEDNIPHRDLYLFGNPYIQRLRRHGAMPIGILPEDGHIDTDVLDLCDGFLLAGGNKIWPYHLQVIAYAHQARKPLLGICLGMQAMSAYFDVLARAGQDGDILALFKQMKKERFMFTNPVANHYMSNVIRHGAAQSKHPITIYEGTRLHEAMGTTHMDAVSLHGYRVSPDTGVLKISAVTQDGTVEGIEYGGYLVGVQFHPEVDDAFDPLFAAFVSGAWTMS